MSGFVPGIAQSVAGVNQAERVAARDADRKKQERKAGEAARAGDHLDLESVAGVDAVRSLKGNEQEEAGADREKRASYQPQNAQEMPPQLDVEA